MKKKLTEIFRTYIYSYDTIIAVTLTILCVFFMPSWTKGELIKDLLGMGIGVISIVFSIFFAALAFIIGASDDEFVSFLEEYGLFTKLINTFKWTVFSLFVSLLYSIIIYVIIAFKLSESKTFIFHETLITIFCFLFFYSLIATMQSTNDAIKYAKRRIKFTQIKKANSEQKEN
ncbi:hypothetical protein [Kordia zhangzhouensis]|uniref:hypothetical protein n=1 Tax=Kordia zhangzhouensis TaxID=1620405 RepID=UPI000629789D|nr:hypothetical protein [Kordia zhangzhouensis]